jgi:nucleoside-diphosphate-sugar epimerase
MTEDSKVEPQYPYGISKLQTEYSIMNMRDRNFRPISLRKGTVGGWSPRMRFDLVVNTMTKYALTQGRIVVHNPNLWRPLVDIRDVIQAYKKSIFSDLAIDGVFNICHKNYTIGQLADDIKTTLQDNGYDVNIQTESREDVRNYLASNNKAMNVLDFKPQYSPKDSIVEILSNLDTIGNFDNKRYYNIATFKDLK